MAEAAESSAAMPAVLGVDWHEEADRLPMALDDERLTSTLATAERDPLPALVESCFSGLAAGLGETP